MLMISLYTDKDYQEVAQLIQENGLIVPSQQELNGYGLVYRVEEKIVGFVWGLTNENCATVFIDYFIVKKDFRSERDQFGSGKIAVEIILKLLCDMLKMGKTRVIGQLPDDEMSRGLERIYSRVGMGFMKPHAFVFGDIRNIIQNMIEGKHGKQDNSTNNYSGSDA